MTHNKRKTKNIIRALIVITLAAAVGVVIYAKNAARNNGSEKPVKETKALPVEPSGAALPKLVDLGATKCIPCKMMAPILEGLKKEYAGKMDVEFIDVWENPDAGKSFGIKMIPTQIFFAPDGKELFRHEGFFSKEDIMEKWKSLGFELNK
jgi:thioredoxin 1